MNRSAPPLLLTIDRQCAAQLLQPQKLPACHRAWRHRTGFPTAETVRFAADMLALVCAPARIDCRTCSRPVTIALSDCWLLESIRAIDDSSLARASTLVATWRTRMAAALVPFLTSSRHAWSTWASTLAAPDCTAVALCDDDIRHGGEHVCEADAAQIPTPPALPSALAASFKQVHHALLQHLRPGG